MRFGKQSPKLHTLFLLARLENLVNLQKHTNRQGISENKALCCFVCCSSLCVITDAILNHMDHMV